MPVGLGAYISHCRLDDHGEGTIGKAQDGKRVERGMERKPRKRLWVAGQDDGPCRQKEDLEEDKVSSKCSAPVLGQSPKRRPRER
jgi:hypothetical protein